MKCILGELLSGYPKRITDYQNFMKSKNGNMANMKFLEKLILSLSDSEIRDFKWFAQRHGSDSSSLALFQAIQSRLKGKSWKYQQEKGLSDSQLSDQRRYLRKSILNSLTHRKFAKSGGDFSLETVKVLLEKGFLMEAKKELRKVLKTALKNDAFPILIQIQSLKARFPNLADKEFFAQELEVSERLKTHFELRSLRLKLRNGFQEVSTPGKKISIIDSLTYNHPLLNHPDKIDSVRNKAEYHQIKRLIHHFKREYLQGIFHAQEYIKIRENHPDTFQDDGLEYIRELGRIVSMNLLSGQLANTIPYLTKIQNFKTHSTQVRMEMVHFGYAKSLEFALDQGDEKVAREVIQHLLSHREQMPRYLGPKAYQKNLYACSYYFCATHQWETAEKYLMELTESTSPNGRTLHWEFAKLLILICRYEQKQHFRLEEEIDSWNRYMKRNPPQFQLLKLVPHTLEILLSTPEANRQATVQAEILKYQELMATPSEAQSFGYLDFPSWLLTQSIPKRWIDLKKEATELSNGDSTNSENSIAS